MTRKEKKEELIGLFAVGAIFIGDLIDECIEYGQQHPQWISVEDELPKINPNDSEWEYSNDVIVSLKDGSITMGRYERDNSIGEHYWVLYGVDKDLVVTHWMPTPQPPVVSKSENAHIIGTAEHIKIALDVMNKKGGEK